MGVAVLGCVVVALVSARFRKQLVCRRRGAAYPFDATLLARGSLQILERKLTWIFGHRSPLRQSGKHELAHPAPVPALARGGEVGNCFSLPGQRHQGGP